MDNIKQLFSKPSLMAVVGDINTGKSNLLYHIIRQLQKDTKFNLYTYGLRNSLNSNEQKIYSVEELEVIRNSIIVIDEFFTLFDLDDRKKKRLIESTLRLIHHNNNIVILCGLPENYKKFVSAKVEITFFKKCTIADLINGSKMKNVIMGYKGQELGSTVINIETDKTIIFDGKHYSKMDVKYYEEYDCKRNNQIILKNVQKPVQDYGIKPYKIL